MKHILGPKYDKAANMFCITIFSQTKQGQPRQEIAWFQTEEEAKEKITEEMNKV